MLIKNYGLIGKKLGHSFSKVYFTKKFQNLNIKAEYLNFELDQIEQFPSVLKTENLAGLNVTIPYKESIIPFLDDLSEEAKAIGAVNTIEFSQGKLIGHNTDAFGFKQSIKPFFKGRHEFALILGTGGASKAVYYVLNELGVRCKFVSRNPKEGQLNYTDLNKEIVAGSLIVVNTTPLGMHPDLNSCPELPFDAISSNHLLVDLIYNPEETIFLKNARSKGAIGINGLSMLHQQAEKAWEIWTRL